jgi:hypothetical protein
MNIQELLEQVEMEAVGHARHAKSVREKLLLALKNSLADSRAELEENHKLEKALDQLSDGNGGLLTNLLSRSLRPKIESEFCQILEKISPKTFAIGKWKIKVIFDVLRNQSDGKADRNTITINKKLSSRLAVNIAKLVVQQPYDSVINWLTSNESLPISLEQKPVVETLNRIISVFIHEITHVHQAYQQRLRKNKDIEYRSYADQTPGEFLNLALTKADGSRPLSPKQQARYDELYPSSPQEIAALSTQIAGWAAEHLGLDNIKTVPELRAVKIPPELLPELLNHTLQQLLPPGTDVPERVKRRYLKFSYQELDGIRDEQIKNLQQQQQSRKNTKKLPRASVKP